MRAPPWQDGRQPAGWSLLSGPSRPRSIPSFHTGDPTEAERSPLDAREFVLLDEHVHRLRCEEGKDGKSTNLPGKEYDGAVLRGFLNKKPQRRLLKQNKTPPSRLVNATPSPQHVSRDHKCPHRPLPGVPATPRINASAHRQFQPPQCCGHSQEPACLGHTPPTSPELDLGPNPHCLSHEKGALALLPSPEAPILWVLGGLDFF